MMSHRLTTILEKKYETLQFLIPFQPGLQSIQLQRGYKINAIIIYNLR